jgi:hypothetical protein
MLKELQLQGCMLNKMEEEAMKQNVITVFILPAIIIDISGFILSKSPAPRTLTFVT